MTDEEITVAHGSGAERTREFLESAVLPRFAGADAAADEAGAADGTGTGDDPGATAAAVERGLAAMDDGAVLADRPDGAGGTGAGDGRLVVTTDSHVVDPPTFPGGDLGELAVAGTVNDLAAMGATDPLTLTCSLVVAAGTDTALVERTLDSMAAAADDAGVPITTGDTKVLRGGELDGLVVNTTGVARARGADLLPIDGLSSGDRLVVTGPVGDHGIALLAEREAFEFAAAVESDVAPVADLVDAATDAGDVTAATDPTRGGLATAVNELAAGSEVGVVVEERSVPVAADTAGAAEVLGLDPLTVACEGRMVLGVAPDDAAAVRDRLREAGATDAAVIGEAVADHPGRAVLDTGIGERYLTEPTDEQLPRIC